MLTREVVSAAQFTATIVVRCGCNVVLFHRWSTQALDILALALQLYCEEDAAANVGGG